MLIGALWLVTGPVLAENARLRDLTLEQASAVQVGTPRPGSLQVSVSADRPEGDYVVGETVHLTLFSNEDAYVTVLSFGPTGRVTQLFPNQYQPDSRVVANRPLVIAGPDSGARVTVAGPLGAELIKVVASNQPLTIVAESQLQGRGVFRTIEGGARAAVRNLQVVARESAQSGIKIYFANFTIYTVASRPRDARARQTLGVVPDRVATGSGAPAIVPATVPRVPATPIGSPSH
jgi:hypothetical protein